MRSEKDMKERENLRHVCLQRRGKSEEKRHINSVFYDDAIDNKLINKVINK
jgi:hypothetical protein